MLQAHGLSCKVYRLPTKAEWENDWYDASHYRTCSPGCTHSIGPLTGSARVHRGAWGDLARGVRSASRYFGWPENRICNRIRDWDGDRDSGWDGGVLIRRIWKGTRSGYKPAKALSRASIRSCSSSMPTDTRTNPSDIPPFSLLSCGTHAWVIDAGC